MRDVDRVLADAAACREVLGMLGKVPSFASRSSYEQHIQSQTMAGGRATSSSAELWQGRVIRVATWNIAGGQRSEEAPERFSAEDQRSAVMHEIRRWHISYGCDVLALQECDLERAYDELEDSHVLVASVEAKDSCGYVHVYVRHGLNAEPVEMKKGAPCAAVRLELE